MGAARACTHMLMLALLLAGARGAAAAPPVEASGPPPEAGGPPPEAGGPPPGAPSPAPAVVLASWSAPAACAPDARRVFAGRVAAFIGPGPAAPARVAVRITEEDGQLSLWLHIDSASAAGERTLRGPSCAVVLEAAAFIVALTIAPAGAQTSAFQPPPQVQGFFDDELPLPLVPTDEQLYPPPPEGQEAGLRLLGSPLEPGVYIMGGGDAGLLPGYAPMARAALTVQWRRGRLELGAAHLFEQRVAAAEPSTGGLISATMATLRGCVELELPVVPAFLCASGELGRFSSRGYGPFGPSPVERMVRYAAVAAATGLDVPLGPVRVRLDMELVRPLVRPRFQLCVEGTFRDCVEPLTTFWQPAALSTRAFIGVEATFR